MNRDELDQERPVPAVPAPAIAGGRRALPPARPRPWYCVSCRRELPLDQVAQGRCPECRDRGARLFLRELAWGSGRP